MDTNSKFFTPIINLTIPTCEGIVLNKESFDTLWENVRLREKKKGRNNPKFLISVMQSLDGHKFLGIEKQFSATVYRFTKPKPKNIDVYMKAADNNIFGTIYGFMKAQKTIEQAILNGAIDEKGKGIVAYFDSSSESYIDRDNIYYFTAIRESDGEIRVTTQLWEPEQRFGHGICLSEGLEAL